MTPDDRERAAEEAAGWIKALRQLPVDGVPLRDRFTYRGDSLWWFAELYLHKQGVIERLWRQALAAARQGVPFRIDAPAGVGAAAESRLALDLKSRFYTWSALASRARSRPRGFARGAGDSGGAGGTLAFVHSAFWRKPAPRAVAQGAAAAQGMAGAPGAAGAPGVAGAGGAAGAAVEDVGEGHEGYIGAVLHALQARDEARPVRLIGVGPRTNFKARRWWHAMAPSRTGAGEIPVEPIERFASWPALAGSRRVWRERFEMERALLASEAIRAHARILGQDVWPIIADELRGIARLQFPWSARAMDEAGAAMDSTRPGLVVTYAEAGGWGRALMLEARRRGIPSVGLQHGFIYRHWLNYRHEADEMQPSPANPADRGFPLPTRTLVYDGYAARHLMTAGHFPADAIQITGSPSLDALVDAISRLDASARARIRSQLLASTPDPAAAATATAADAADLIVLVTKFTQVRDALPALLQAVAMLENVRLVITPHPAETAQSYPAAERVMIAPPALDLARLLAVAKVVVTVNSTVAIDAIALGVPAVVIGLPNNLSPFVDAGVMLGSVTSADASHLADLLRSLLQDDTRRAALLARARAFAAEQAMTADGRAAERAAEAMVGIMAGSRGANGG